MFLREIKGENMTIDEQIAILQAFKEGKTIEFFNHITNEWELKEGNGFSFEAFNYRISEYKYIPFDNTDNLIGIIVMDKYIPSSKRMITGQNDREVSLSGATLDYSYLFNNYTIDGHPAGKLSKD